MHGTNWFRVYKRIYTYIMNPPKLCNLFSFQWNLVCDNAWLRATSDSIFMVGVMLGSMIFGGISDKYGRRVAFFSALIVQLIGGILVSISPNYISYMIFRLIVGSTTSGVFLVAYVIGTLIIKCC